MTRRTDDETREERERQARERAERQHNAFRRSLRQRYLDRMLRPTTGDGYPTKKG